MIGEIVAVTGHRPQHLSLEDGYWIQDEFDRRLRYCRGRLERKDPRWYVELSGVRPQGRTPDYLGRRDWPEDGIAKGGLTLY